MVKTRNEKVAGSIPTISSIPMESCSMGDPFYLTFSGEMNPPVTEGNAYGAGARLRRNSRWTPARGQNTAKLKFCVAIRIRQNRHYEQKYREIGAFSVFLRSYQHFLTNCIISILMFWSFIV